MRGRKPVPTSLRLMRGNPGKRPLNPAEPKPDIAIPKRPRQLGKEGRAEWNRLTKWLAQQRIIALGDRAKLWAFCKAWELAQISAEKVECDGITNLELIEEKAASDGTRILIVKQRQSAHAQYLDKMLKHIRGLGSDLGLDASASSRIHASPPERHFHPLLDPLYAVGVVPGKAR